MPSPRIPLGSYLFNRLKQAGVGHVYGVPGDFTLKALDQLNASGLRFVGCCNELNAGYAADGYARARRWRSRAGGLGALFTTYGVGELSAANAVACSYAEHVPMVHLVGTPSRRTLQMSAASGEADRSHLHIHHTLKDPRAGVFREIAAKFTVAQLNLAEAESSDAPKRVDWVLSQALEKSRPVYVELPSDKVAMEVDSGALGSQLSELEEDGTAISTANARRDMTDSLLERLYSSKRPMILVDRGDGVDDFREEISEFAARSGLPTLALPSGAGMVDGGLKNYFGIHSGRMGAIDTTQFVHSADLILAFGPMFADTQTLGWEVVPKREKMVFIGKNDIDCTPVKSKAVIQNLIWELDATKLPSQDTTSLGDYRPFEPQITEHDGPIDQAQFYLMLNRHLQPNDTILLGNATPIIGGRDLVLPPSAQTIASGMSFSIGHMLPAALGVAQGQADSRPGRTILLDGDGSFQVTAQELSTIIHERANVTIFIINNAGYTYERLIHGENEEYNDVAPWNYLEAPCLFGGAPSGYQINKHRVSTWRELDSVLDSEEFRRGKGLTLVDVVMGRMDVPPRARAVFEGAGDQL